MKIQSSIVQHWGQATLLHLLLRYSVINMKPVHPEDNVHVGNDNFFQNDVRTKKGLDEHGCLGDIGW